MDELTRHDERLPDCDCHDCALHERNRLREILRYEKGAAFTEQDMAQDEKPWWFPELADDAWLARIRADYPEETAELDDETVREQYADGRKYADTWDHLGDARDQFEKLADAYLALLAKAGSDS